jgi:hypothetical protein
VAVLGLGEMDEGVAVVELERRVAEPGGLCLLELLVDGADELLVSRTRPALTL